MTTAIPSAAGVLALGVSGVLAVDLGLRPRAWQLRRPATALRAHAAALITLLLGCAALLTTCLLFGLRAAPVGTHPNLLRDAWPSLVPTTALFFLGGLLAVVGGRGAPLRACDQHTSNIVGALVQAASCEHDRRPGSTVTYVAASQPFACAVPGPRPRVIVTRGLSDALSAAELDAVVAHELHHLTARHDLHVQAARLVAACLPCKETHRYEHRVRLLAELASDDHAVRRVGDPRVVASALDRLADLTACPAATLRAERLRRMARRCA